MLSAGEWRERLAARGLELAVDLPYATRRAASLWELLATSTGGIAYLLAGGKAPPRRIQQSRGLVRPDRGWLGTACFALLLPLIAAAAVQRNRPPYAGRLVVAAKGGPTG